MLNTLTLTRVRRAAAAATFALGALLLVSTSADGAQEAPPAQATVTVGPVASPPVAATTTPATPTSAPTTPPPTATAQPPTPPTAQTTAPTTAPTGATAGATPPAQTTPAAPLPTNPPGSTTEETTVAGVSGAQLTINKADGTLQTLTVGANVAIVRNGQPVQLDALEGSDRIVIRRSAAGEVLSILVTAAAPPLTPSPAAQPSAVATPPAPASTGTPAINTPAPVGTPAAIIYTGSIDAVNGAVITVAGDDGSTREIDTAAVPGLTVTRNDSPSAASALQAGDDVTVVYGANNQPTSLDAVAPTEEPNSESGLGTSWIPYALLLLAPFLLLLIPLLGRRAGRPYVVQRKQRD